MTRIIATKHLAYLPDTQQIFARHSADLIEIDDAEELGFTALLGDIWHGTRPDVWVPQDVQSEWVDLVEWEAERQDVIVTED